MTGTALFDKALRITGTHERVPDARAAAVGRRFTLALGGIFVVGGLIAWPFGLVEASVILVSVGVLAYFSLLVDRLSGNEGLFAPVSTKVLEAMLKQSEARPAAKQLLVGWLEDGQAVRLRDKRYFDRFVRAIDTINDRQAVRDLTVRALQERGG